MTVRVAIFGPECSGKTTLACHLARIFDAPWAPEYVRSFWEERRGDIRRTDLGAIARGQIENEDSAAARAKALVICDTELITNTLWADLLFPGACPVWVRREAEFRARRYALYLLCATDIDFVDDGQRCFPGTRQREHCGQLWRSALVERGLPFVDVQGSLHERIAIAVSAIERTIGLAAARD